MKAGVYDGLSNAQYHGGPGDSKSGLDLIHRSPLHYKAARDARESGEEREETAAQRIGTALHALILEPEVFAANYVVAPKVDRRTKDGKATWEAFQAANEGKEYLTDAELDQLQAMDASVHAHPAASALLFGAEGVAERSAYWIDEKTGLLCRCRPDFWRHDGIVVDLKSTEDAAQEAFSRSVANWRYYVQHPFYLDGCAEAIRQAKLKILPPAAFAFVVVEKKAPYAVAVYVLDPASVELGRLEYRHDLDRLAHARKTGIWPGYGDAVQTIGVPQWHLAKNASVFAEAAT